MSSKFLRACGALLIVVLASSPAGAEGIRKREMLGARFGAVMGSSSIDDAFGAGSELELYFVEGLGAWWGIGLNLSSHNFGASQDTLANIAYTGQSSEVEMGIFGVTAAVFGMRPLNQRFTATVEGGAGLYTTSATIQLGFSQGSHSENRFGMYGGAGVLMRISKGLSLNLNAKYHYVFIGSDGEEVVHAYTGETSARFFQIAIGLLIFTS